MFSFVIDKGNMNDKGEWNGVVRKLIDKQADIGLGSMSVMAERETVIDFTVPYYDLVGITIMVREFGYLRPIDISTYSI